jgi:hypothetical protein
VVAGTKYEGIGNYYVSVSVMDVRNAGAPAVLGIGQLSQWSGGLSVTVPNRTALYLGSGLGSTVRVYDLSTPSDISLLSSFQISETGDWGALDIVFEGSRAYIIERFVYGGGSRLATFDVSNIMMPDYLGDLSGVGTIAPSPDGKYLLAAMGAGLSALDMSNPTAPEVLSSLDLKSVRSIVTSDGYTYVVADGGLHVVKVDSEGKLERVGGYQDPEDQEAQDLKQVVASGGYVYMSGSAGGNSWTRVLRPEICYPPSIDAPPENQAVPLGGTGTLTVHATGTQPISYQWYRGATGDTANPINGATGSLLPFGPITSTTSFWVRLSNSDGSADSPAAVISVVNPPTITREPQDTTALAGTNVLFSVTTGGTPPFGYLWRFNGQPLPGATNAILELKAVQVTNSGAYSVIVSNAAGTVQSREALLTVFSSANLARLATWPGHALGNAVGVEIVGDLAYLALGDGGLGIINVSDPASPRGIGGCETPGSAHRIALTQTHAFVPDGDAGLQVINVTNPAAPFKVGTYDTLGTATGVAVSGDFAYVADGTEGLVVLDVRNPTAPVLAAKLSMGGDAQAVAAAGSTIYVANGAKGFQVVDATNPATPTLAGSYPTPGKASAVVVAGSYAYVGDDLGSVHVIDVGEPSLLVKLSSFSGEGGVLGLRLIGGTLYVAHGNKGFSLVDVSNPGKPVLTATLGSRGQSHDVAVSKGHIFVANGTEGLGILELDGTFNVVAAIEYYTSGEVLGVAVADGYAYLASGTAGLRVIDVTEPGSPILVGRNKNCVDACGVAAAGGFAYVADGNHGLQTIDVTVPSNPLRVGDLPLDGRALGVAVSGQYAYVAAYYTGLQIINVSNPAVPRRIGQYSTTGYAYAVTVEGSLALVADWYAGLQVIDVSNPMAPVRIGGFDTKRYAYGVAFKQPVALVADGDGGLQFLDLSAPNAPLPLAVYLTGGDCRGVAAAGIYACAVTGDRGLQVIDFSNPSSPFLAGALDTPGFAQAVAVAGTTVYVADGSQGMAVFQIQLPPVPDKPSITLQPLSQVAAFEASVTFTASAVGTPPLTFQWYEGPSGDTNTPIPGATTTNLTIEPAVNDTAFWLRVTNPVGTTDSLAATITVAPQFTASVKLGVGFLTLSLRGPDGTEWIIQRSSDLTTWEPVPAVEPMVLSGGTTLVSLPPSSLSREFYRVVKAP